MSIFNSFKKAFGFPDTYDDENDVDSDDADSPEDQDDNGRPRLDLTPPTRPSEPTPKPAETSPEKQTQEKATVHEPEPDTAMLAAKAFDCVVELFNGIQPEFVRQCLDTDAQRRYITEHIDSSLRTALEEATASARRRGQQQWQSERSRLASDLDSLRKQYATMKQQREEFQNAQLSASRQKRALSDRVHDLESQVAALEAEKEQFQIENRSMANKLRASGVVRDMAAADAPDPELAKTLEETKKALEEQTRIATEQTEKAEKLEARTQELEARIELDKKERADMEEEMQKNVSIIDSRIADFERLKKKKDARIAQLSASVKESEKRISELESALSDRQKKLDEASAMNESLRSTIEDNLLTHANVEHTLRLEIEGLKTGKTDTDATLKPAADYETPQTETIPRHTSKISAIDDLMDNTDWFVAPDPIPLKKDPEVEEQFGYKEPKSRQNRQADDDKQLSLF